MEISDFNIGQIVRSTKGRDQGHIFVVIGILDDQHLLVTDGDLRRVDKPKKKRRSNIWQDLTSFLKK